MALRWYSNQSSDGVKTLRLYRFAVTCDVSAVALLLIELGKHGTVWSVQRSQPGSTVAANGREAVRIHWLASPTLEARSSRVGNLIDTAKSRVRSSSWVWLTEAATITEGARADVIAARPRDLTHNETALSRAAEPRITERAADGARAATSSAAETIGNLGATVADEVGDAAQSARNMVFYVKVGLGVVAALATGFLVLSVVKEARS